MTTLSAFNALRAISALVLRRFMQPIAYIAAGLLVALYVATIALGLSVSAWWWLLLLILLPVTTVFVFLVYVLWFLLHRLLPRKINSAERSQIKAFADKLAGIAERTKTPYPILLFLIGKDVIRGRESGFLRDLIGDSKSVTKDFAAIQKLFM